MVTLLLLLSLLAPARAQVAPLWRGPTNCRTMTGNGSTLTFRIPPGLYFHMTFIGVWGPGAGTQAYGLHSDPVFLSNMRWETDRYPVRSAEAGHSVFFRLFSPSQQGPVTVTVCGFEGQ